MPGYPPRAWPRLRRRQAGVDVLNRVIREDADLPPERADARWLRAFTRRADQEQVLFTVADRLRDAGNLPPESAELVQRRITHAMAVRREAGRIHEALQAAGVAHAFIKGPALQRLWPAGRQRQFNDIDLVARGAGDWGAAADALSPLGYEIEAASLEVGTSGSGVLYLTDRGARSAEIHFGTLTVNYWHPVLRFDDAFWHELDLSAGLPFPSRRWMAAILVAEVLERRRLSLRDQLDARAVLGQLDAGDQAWLSAVAAQAHLTTELGMTRDAAELGAGGRRTVRSGTTGRLRRLSRAVAPSASRAVRHVLPSHSPLGRGRAARAAAASMLRDWSIERLDEHPEHPAIERLAIALNGLLTPLVVTTGGCAFLVPLDAGARGDFAFTRSGSDWIARTPAGSFLAVALPSVSRSRLAAAGPATGPAPAPGDR